MEYIKAFSFFMGGLVIASFGYFESIAFSTGLPMPDFVVEQTTSSANPSNKYYWCFIVLTLNLPFTILAGLCGFLFSRYTYTWVVPTAFATSLVYFQSLSLDILHWWSVFLMAVVTSWLLALLGKKNRNKSNHII